MNEWSHLPNAVHIDAVLVSVAAHPAHWRQAARVLLNPNTNRAFAISHATARSQVKQMPVDERMERALGDAVFYAAPMESATYFAVWNAVIALVLNDRCAHLLSMPPDQVRVLAGLEVTAAVLLLPATMVFAAIKVDIVSVA